ncbi:MAG TPA: pirin family protein [Paenalcaligenes sp.]|nr:pirin family protein [Paenalcaligenes sp.]
MIERRPFNQLGQTKINWLHARHHFSFGHYRHPGRDHWGTLRVWNDDIIQPHQGFPPHPHDNMEIITYVQSGAISHKDSLGNSGRTEAGDVQVMSAGTGITHSEYNHENTETQLFQIWILPEMRDQPPSWGTRSFPQQERSGQFTVLASGFDTDTDALPIRTPSRVLGATVEKGQTIVYEFDSPDRYGYLVPAQGVITVNGIEINTRDGAAITGETSIEVKALETAEIVLVDTPALRSA